MKSHYTIPFFIPHQGCPFTCIFCQQRKISGRGSVVTAAQIAQTISRFSQLIPRERTHREVAFFGGSFTGIDRQEQETYLKAVLPFIESGAIHSVRVSTRPDFIDEEIFIFLKKYHVSTIELGVQSICDDVLARAKRGHTGADVRRASRQIVSNGLTLGHQIMVGLPGSTVEKERRTARAAIALGAREARVYPVVVIRGTALAVLAKKGRY
ncbi:MAG: radical SAM protein, partial [Candidatus Omnitrophota bacterium]